MPLRGSSSVTREQNAPCLDTVTSSRLLRVAVNASLNTAQRRRVLNEFAAKGYVRELRKHQKKKGKYIVNITLGRNQVICRNKTRAKNRHLYFLFFLFVIERVYDKLRKNKMSIFDSCLIP